MEFRILGPLQVITDGRPVDLGDRRHRILLSLLLVNRDRTVPVEYLIDAVWDERPPATARRQIQNCVSALRRALAGPGAAQAIIADRGSYRIGPAAADLDAQRFEEQVAEAGDLAATDPAAAVAGLRAALRLWRGPALLGLPGRQVQAAANALEEQRLATVEHCLDLDLGLGRHQSVIAELAELVSAHPYREHLVELLMLALFRSGRQAEALAAYHRLREALTTELGLDPGAAIQALYTTILRNEPAVVEAPDPTPVPAQLPPDLIGFAGRTEHLAWLDAFLPNGPETAAVIAAVAGMAGVGKTTLAVHWGHRVRDRFPDGQLYVNLRGYSPEAPMRSPDALSQLLQALGTRPERVPPDPDVAAALYRSLTAGRRMLVLLDNAASAEQVRPLLPGDAGCMALVTSRDRLSGLVAVDGARQSTLEVLRPDEARDLLAAILGPDRLAAESTPLRDLAEACSHLPLALSVAAANAVDHPARAIAEQVAALRNGGRWSGLELDGDEHRGVHRAFEQSYRALRPGHQRLFRLIGLAPGADLTADAAAGLAGTTVDEARSGLDRLARAHLITASPGGRYGCHDLVRHFAAGCAERDESTADRATARLRLLHFFLYSTGAAAQLLYPEKRRLPLPPAPAGTAMATIADREAALSFLDSERANLLAVIRHCADNGPRQIAWLLADTLRGYLWMRMLPRYWADAATAALAAAEAEGDLRAQAAALLSLGDVDDGQRQRHRAIEHFTRALVLCEQVGWESAQCTALGKLGVVHRDSGHLAEAAEYFHKGLSLCRRTGAAYTEAVLLGCLSRVHAQQGRPGLAIDGYRRALALCEGLGARQGQAAALDAIGEALHAQGRHAEAEQHLCRGLAIEREIGDLSTQFLTLRSLVAVYRETGDTDRLAVHVQALRDTADQLGDRRADADTLRTLAAVDRRAGLHHIAVERYSQALDIIRATGYPYPEVQTLIDLALVLLDLGDIEPARHRAQQAHTLATTIGYGGEAARAAALLARLPQPIR